jgi:hypothetical protein
MMKPALDAKKPSEEKDYGIDWAPQINDTTVTIDSSDWAIVTALGSPDLVIEVDSVDDQQTVVRLSGGEADRDYVLENTIVTSEGETLIEAIEVQVKSAADAAGIY